MKTSQTAILVLLLASWTWAGDGAPFQGPGGDGTAPERKLLRSGPA